MSEHTCRVCGVALDYAGTGRRPTLCEDHKEPSKRKDRAPSSRNGRAVKATTAKTNAALRADLLDLLNGAGAMLLMVDQFDGAVMINGAPKLADALVALADQNPAFRRWLTNGAQSVTWIQLGTAVAAIVVPIAAHHGMLPVDERAAFRLFYPQFQPAPEPAPAPAPAAAEPAAETVAEPAEPVAV